MLCLKSERKSKRICDFDQLFSEFSPLLTAFLTWNQTKNKESRQFEQRLVIKHPKFVETNT